ncbi:MAG: helix-turn-helix domain-containing protein [Candidatus Omnitrophica bacterium]|nr:helix-turn-helix domain-containing protein [Candidatus Omnitrophota bacterium]MCM8801929.1 helix-turn-helix domain-containing protein [Candidatus Omnitrophota bacterium]
MKNYIFSKELGKKIKEIRKTKKYTQSELAWAIGVSPNFIGLIERGKKMPSLKTLFKISKTLEIPISYFFEEFKYQLHEEDILIKKISSLLKETSEDDKKVIYKLVKSIIKRKK